MADLEKLYAALDKADAAGETQDANDIAAMIRGQMAQPSKPEDVGFLTGSAAALKGGIESLGDVYSGLSLAKEATIGTEAETARKMQAIKVAQQQQPQTPQLSAADIERVYKEQGLGAAAAQVPKYISESILQSAPQMAVPLAAGAAASPFLTPIGGALVGMGTYGIQQFGNFLVRQAQEKNNPKDLEVAKAATTAAITAPLGYYADKFTAGIGGMVEKKAGEEILKELTARQIAAKVGKRAAVGATEGIIAEAPVEVLEQAAERYQAGLSLTGEDAMKEYKEAFFGATAAGAGIGGVSRGVSAYREGRGQELPPVPPTPPKEEQAEPTMVPASQSQDTEMMMAETEGRPYEITPPPETTVEPPKPPPIQAALVQPPIQAPVQTTVEAAPKTAPEAVLPIQETPKELPVKSEELPHPYQSELTQLYKQRNALSKEKDNLNVWLRKVGINPKEKADMGIERGSKDYPYVFRSNAQGLDVLMHDAIESGIITESDLARYPDPVEGFREMAKAAIDGQTANTPKNMETIANLEAIDSRIEKLESIPKEDYALHAQALEQATTEQERAKAEEDAQAQAEMDRLAEESKQNALPPTGEQDEDIQFAQSSMEGNTPAEKAANTLKNNGHSAEIVYDKDGISLIKTINPRNGDVIYVPSKNGVTFSQMHDVDSKNGALQLDALKLNSEQKNNLITARNELEKQEEEKHKKTPFLSMKSGLSGSPKAPKDIVNIARGWVKMLGMDYLDIHIITKEEAAANKDNFTGPHRPIGWMGEKLQQGAVRKLDDGSYALVLRPSTSKTKMLEIIAHEIGHIHEKFAFDSASEYTQKKIIKEFNAWFDTHGNISAKELVESMRPRAMARATRFEDPMMQASKAKAYWRSFGEWYADQVARWATSSEKPLTVVDKFFKKIADALKKFYATVKGQKYLPTESMKNFLDNVARQNAFDEIADRKNKGQMALFAKSQMEAENPTKQDKHRNINGMVVSPVWNSPEVSKIDDLLYKLQDKHIDTKRVIEEITKSAGVLDDKWNVYLQEELYHGRTSSALRNFLLKDLLPTVKEMKKLNVSPEEMNAYLHFRHATERNDQIAKIRPEFLKDGSPNPDAMTDKGSGKSYAEIDKYFKELDPAKEKNLKEIAKRFDSMVKGTQNVLVKSGAETQDTIDAWNNTYKNYAPLFRVDDDFASHPSQGTGAGFSSQGPASKRATGSTKEVQDIMGNILAQRERALIKAEKIRVGKALYGAAIKNPNPKFWLPVNPDAIKSPEHLAAELQSLGLDGTDVVGMMEEKKKPEIYTDPQTGLQTVKYKVNPLERYKDNVFPVRINGKDRYIFFNQNDPRAKRMVEAMKNLDPNQLGEALGTVGKLTRWFAAVNTQYNPVFGGINLIRDVQSAMFNLSTTKIAGEQKSVASGIYPAMRAIYATLRAERSGNPIPDTKETRLWQDFRKEGGQTLYRDSLVRKAEEKQIVEHELEKLGSHPFRKAFMGAADLLSDFNDTIENSVRLSAYKVALKKGLSEEQAASLAKNLTVNFDRKGALGSNINALYAFFNASMQGSARLAQTLKGPAGRKIIGGGILLGSMQAIALAAAGFDEDEPPDFIKEKNLVIPLPDHKYALIPMPLGLHLFPNIGRETTEWAISGFKNPGKHVTNMMGTTLDSFNPLGGSNLGVQTLTPTLLDPLVALEANKDAFGRPIYKADRATNPTPGYLRSRDGASEISKLLSEFLNYASGGTEFKKGAISPTADALDYLAGQFTGGAGREVMKTEEAVKAVATGEELPSYRIPLAGRFYGDTESKAADSQRFYDNVTRMSEHENEIKGRQKSKGDVTGYINENPEAKLWQRANNVENQISQLNKRKKDFQARGLPKEKITAIDDQKQQIMKRFNEQVKALQD